MSSVILRRPAAALAVVAVLLAIAAPASAAVGVRENGSQGAVVASAGWPDGTGPNTNFTIVSVVVPGTK